MSDNNEPTAFSRVIREDLKSYGYGTEAQPEDVRVPDPITPPITEPVDEIEQSLKELSDNMLAEKGIKPEKEFGDRSFGDAAEEIAYGAVKGKEELTVINNVNDYLITSQPEIASMMGLTRRGQTREVMKAAPTSKIIVDAIKDAYSMTPMGFMAQMAGKVSSEIQEAVSGEVKLDEASTTVGVSPVKITDSVIDKVFARTFATQEDVARMENEWMDENFGKGWEDMPPEMRREIIAQDSDKMLQDAFPDVYGTERAESGFSTVGQFIGAVADPTTLLPAGASYKGAAAIGMSIGVSDAALYGLAKKGAIDPVHVIAAGTLGAVLGPAIKFVGTKAGGFVLKRQNMKQANKVLDKYEKVLNQRLAAGEPAEWVHNTARFETGLTSDVVTNLYKHTGREFNVYKQTPAMAHAALEQKASWFLRNKVITKVGRGIEQVIFMKPLILDE